MKWQQAAAVLTTILAIAGVVTYSDLFGVLLDLKGINYTYTGDINCSTTCESYINVTTSYWRICFAHYNDTKFENETLFKKVSRSRTLHVNLNNVDNVITTNPKVEVDWMVPARSGWRDIKDGDCWDRGKINKIKLVGHKHASQTIKWSFITGDYVDIDPEWVGNPFLGEKNITYKGVKYSKETYEIEVPNKCLDYISEEFYNETLGMLQQNITCPEYGTLFRNQSILTKIGVKIK